jgi:hypothetical protein
VTSHKLLHVIPLNMLKITFRMTLSLLLLLLLSRNMCVTIDGGLDNWIYRPLTGRNYK